jgi:predicted permease
VYLLIEPKVAANYRGMQSRTTHTTFYAVARLKTGVSIASARADLEGIQSALSREFEKTTKSIQLVTLSEWIVGNMAATLAALAGGVGLLLLITCVNLGGLLLNRSLARAREFRIRAAIGGSRWHLIRQLLVEQGVLVAAGGLLGALAGAIILQGLLYVAPRDLPRLDEIHLDLSAMWWITLLSCACAFLFGVVPVLRTSGEQAQSLTLRSGRGTTRSGSWLRSGLMIGEIALATVLLVGSGLMIHTMVRLSRVDPGFDPRNLQSVMLSLQSRAWPDERKQIFYSSIVERLRTVPGVEGAALTYSLPILGSFWWNQFTIAQPGAQSPPGTEAGNAGMVPVTAGYFELLKIPLINGRYFDRSETPASLPVAIINSSLAKKYFGTDNPIGKQIRQGDAADPYGPWRTVVGVVGDIKQHGIDQEMPQQIYLPVVQQPRTTVFAVLRTRVPVLPSSIEAAIHDLDRSIPVFNDRTIEQVMRDASSRRRVATVVLSAFGAIALLLAAIGVYGVVAQGVADRKQEIGVRVALGATSAQVIGLFVRHGLIVVAVGLGVGLVAAIVAAPRLASLVFGISVTDPASLGAVALVLVAVTLCASYLPARSASRIDPLSALRAE